MKKSFFIFLAFLPYLLSAQFDDKEMYGYARLGVDIGMRDITYVTTLDGYASESPVITQLKLSSGFTPEIGFGFMIIDHLFVEGNIGYSIVKKKGYAPENSNAYVKNYSFNRVNIGLNGLYFIDIDNYFTIYFTGGLRAVLPQRLVITTTHNVEDIKYRATMGWNTGFGGNYNHNNFIYGAGLNFKFENLKQAPNQEFPNEYITLNPELSKLKIRSMVLTFTVKYLF